MGKFCELNENYLMLSLSLFKFSLLSRDFSRKIFLSQEEENEKASSGNLKIL
jgi:hypothetical protein